MRSSLRTAVLTLALLGAPCAAIAPATAIPLTQTEPAVVAPQPAGPIGIACILIYPAPPECALASLSAGISSK
ncbi:hypothetical protein HLB23_20020 [Nocardia uniformis]|uniref:Uncharacterized protein n=1 Tax=Nocardia uniformis TaxID=53432 RepID=A0A849C8A4_9NOCA|nr:hypothetical protein [Nocardia uniformis]NNH72117.1 hypothetical protein [Nocardia uniformis]